MSRPRPRRPRQRPRWPSPEADVYREVLSAAEALAAQRAVAEARALLQWLLDEPTDPPVRAAAQAKLDSLPMGPGDWGPIVRLTAWHTALGAWLAGPNIALMSPRHDTPGGFILGGALLGGVVGGGGSLWYADRVDLTDGMVTSFLLSEQLLGFNAASLSLLADDDGDLIPAASAIGALAGVGVGYALAQTDPDDGVMAAASSGMIWGTASAAAFMGATYRFGYTTKQDVLPLAAGADLGAAAGAGLAMALHLTRPQIQLGNVGGLAGGAAMGGFVLATQRAIWWAPGSVVTVIEIGAVTGGAVGVLLARRMDHVPDLAMGSLVSGADEHVRVGLPVPSFTPTAEGPQWHLQLVDYRF